MAHTVTFEDPVGSGRDPVARRLRIVLAANAGTSLLAGIAGLAAAGWWAETLGLSSEGWIRAVSAALVLFALDVALAAARATERLATATLAVSLADLAWVLGTVVVLVAGDLTATGQVVAIVSGVGVLDFAVLQLRLRARLPEVRA